MALLCSSNLSFKYETQNYKNTVIVAGGDGINMLERLWSPSLLKGINIWLN